MTPKQLIDWWGFQQNTVEGGYFLGTYQSPLKIDDIYLPTFPPTGNSRSLCSAIYYLLDSTGCSVMHRVNGDMIYHFYSGDPVQMLLLYPKGHPNRSEVCIFSNDVAAGASPMKVIPGGTWLGSRVVPGGSFALMGVTMAPGFHPQDYALGSREELTQQYPEQASLISTLTPSKVTS